jgi:NADH-quinone oxidoreductase subunit J
VLLAVVLAAELVFALGAWQAGSIQLAQRVAPIDPAVSNIQAIGELLYTRYVFQFEIAGIILLVAMIGAIVLTNRPRSGVRRQDVAAQNARRPEDATRLTNPATGEGVIL